MKAVLHLIIFLALCSCSHNDSARRMRAAYWWSTTLNVDSSKEAFIKTHRIERLYIRYFDVVLNDRNEPTPNATLRFLSALPADLEAVPVVFIVNDCMRQSTEGLAQKILSRVMQMSETNGVNGVKEVQIDCDWTLTTQREFYKFLAEMRRLCHAEGMKLSATVRLHQLSQAPPPSDSGVLMVYNTGDFTRLDCQKPILDVADIRPYLRHLDSYKLPLATAYPVYSWRILFRAGRYVGIMHSDDDLPVLPSDSIVTRQPTFNDIVEAQKAINSHIKTANGETIIFDLSNQNIQRFKAKEYETIFSD